MFIIFNPPQSKKVGFSKSYKGSLKFKKIVNHFDILNQGYSNGYNHISFSTALEEASLWLNLMLLLYVSVKREGMFCAHKGERNLGPATYRQIRPLRTLQ
jgi:hypothetical protein